MSKFTKNMNTKEASSRNTHNEVAARYTNNEGSTQKTNNEAFTQKTNNEGPARNTHNQAAAAQNTHNGAAARNTNNEENTYNNMSRFNAPARPLYYAMMPKFNAAEFKNLNAGLIQHDHSAGKELFNYPPEHPLGFTPGTPQFAKWHKMYKQSRSVRNKMHKNIAQGGKYLTKKKKNNKRKLNKKSSKRKLTNYK
jgi:hypothetical protein